MIGSAVGLLGFMTKTIGDPPPLTKEEQEEIARLKKLEQKVPHRKPNHLFKTAFLIIITLLLVVGFEMAHLKEAKYLAVIFFGYVVHIFWKHNQPINEVNTIWSVLKYLLFGTIGAAIRLKEMDMGIVGIGIVIITIGVFFRCIATVLSVYKKIFVLKEKMFMACAWIPKATVQAAMGGILLDEARKNSARAHLKDEGIMMLTIAVVSVLLTAPLGSILIATLGEKWLDCSSEKLSRTESMRLPKNIS